MEPKVKQSFGSPIPPRQIAETASGFRWQVLLIAILISLWEGFPHVLWGIPDSLGNQIWSVASIIGIALFIVRSLFKQVKLDYFQLLAVVLVLWCYLVSYYFNTFIEPKPLDQWIQSGFVVMSILSIFGLQAIGTKVSDVEYAIVAAGFAASIAAILDTAFDTRILSSFSRGSSFTDYKIVFFKLPSLFSAVIAIAKLFSTRTRAGIIWWAAVTLITSYSVAFLAESRLSIAGLAISCVLMALLVFKGNKRIYFIVLFIIMAVPLSYLIVSRFFSGFTSLSEYFKGDTSTWFRGEEIRHFSTVFANTNGLGFGFMSLDRAYDNSLTFAAYEAGYLVHTGNYGMVVTDIGLYSALYQFGYIGLVLVVGYTLLSGIVLARSRRLGLSYSSSAGVGLLFISLLISPISINYFTVQWSAHIGALIFYMASQVRREALVL